MTTTPETTSEKPEPAPPAFACPGCGASDWRADYYNAVHQGVTVSVGNDGRPQLDAWDGDEETYDDGCTEEDRLVCQACGHVAALGEFRFIPAAAPEAPHV